LGALNERGVAYMNGATWRDGKKAIRAAFSNYSTTDEDLLRIQEELVSIAGDIAGDIAGGTAGAAGRDSDRQ
jgi:hypothetical protein